MKVNKSYAMTTNAQDFIQSPRPIVWSIAASDSGGGAGIQADLNTFHSLECHGCTLITAITAQNSLSVEKIHSLNQVDLEAQWQALESDLAPKAIKIGLITEASSMRWLVKHLAALKEQQSTYCVWDPVLKASTGARFIEAFDRIDIDPLLKTIDLITPNLHEAEQLTQTTIESKQDIKNAAQQLISRGCKNVLIKGGHSFLNAENQSHCSDYFCNAEQSFWLHNEKKNQINNHGTGCTLASAIASFIALGHSQQDAIIFANGFIQQSLRLAAPQGSGAGPIWQSAMQFNTADMPSISDNFTPFNHHYSECSPLGLYAIIDNLADAERLIKLGVDTLQWRAKQPNEQQLKELPKIVTLCKQQQVPLFINDHWQLAIEFNAYGVHLGQEDLESSQLASNHGLQRLADKGIRLGISCHNEFEIARARHFNPSYLAFGPIFTPKSKKVDHPKLGLNTLKSWSERFQPVYPVTCIGGIEENNLNDVLDTGVKSVAVISALASDDGAERFESCFRMIIRNK